jgi:hypothetical protein
MPLDYLAVMMRFPGNQPKSDGHPLVLQYEKVYGKSASEFAEYFHLTLKSNDCVIDWKSAPEPYTGSDEELLFFWIAPVSSFDKLSNPQVIYLGNEFYLRSSTKMLSI